MKPTTPLQFRCLQVSSPSSNTSNVILMILMIMMMIIIIIEMKMMMKKSCDSVTVFDHTQSNTLAGGASSYRYRYKIYCFFYVFF